MERRPCLVPGRRFVIVTPMVVDAVSEKGELLGGAIAPG